MLRHKPHSLLHSQNHRMVGVGRDLCGSSGPTPLPKQGHLEQAAQDRVQAGLEYLQRRRIHSLSYSPSLLALVSQKFVPFITGLLRTLDP